MQDRIHYPEEGWDNCRRCPLHESRRTVVLRGDGRCNRGTVEREGKLLYWRGEQQDGTDEAVLGSKKQPIILFIGEAPGAQEDVTGMPFRGEAGRLFSYCLSYCTTIFDFEIVNILGCRPTRHSKFGNLINRQPKDEEIKQCLPRTEALIKDVTYDGYVYLGEVAKELTIKHHSLSLQHPSYILRQEYKLYAIKEFAMKLDNYVNTHITTQ